LRSGSARDFLKNSLRCHYKVLSPFFSFTEKKNKRFDDKFQRQAFEKTKTIHFNRKFIVCNFLKLSFKFHVSFVVTFSFETKCRTAYLNELYRKCLSWVILLSIYDASNAFKWAICECLSSEVYRFRVGFFFSLSLSLLYEEANCVVGRVYWVFVCWRNIWLTYVNLNLSDCDLNKFVGKMTGHQWILTKLNLVRCKLFYFYLIGTNRIIMSRYFKYLIS
jgi:hypothetical protein